jgi:hypothetical protein
VRPPDDSIAAGLELEGTLKRVVRRSCAASVLRSAGAGIITGALAASIRPVQRPAIVNLVGGILGLAVLCVLVIRDRHRWTTKSAAAAIERVQPDSRNLIVTAEELLRHPDRARPWVRTRVLRDASVVARAADITRATPLRRPVALAIAGVAMSGLVFAGVLRNVSYAVRHTFGQPATEDTRSGSPALRVRATIVAPVYLGTPQRTVEDPERLEAVAGSRLELALSGPASIRVRFGVKPLTISPEGDGRSHTQLPLTESGYLAIDDAADQHSVPRLIAIAVTPDRAPVIRIDRPGKDLLVPDAGPTIPIATSASDDFGLRSLELRYTKVSGSGEQFEFEEGTLPLELDRQTDRDWRGRASLALSKLNLKPGDSVVYRVLGRDGRAGDNGAASSDTYFVEVAAPGQATLAGFELPPERERYALSQQMIVLKIQRLRAREKSMLPPAVRDEAASIAAEQRAVRANFIFLTGGEVENEEEEAEHSHEIQEGRLENTARQEIRVAIQHMGRADRALVSVDTAAALTSAKAAVDALQRAFGRNRYILRTLPVRSRIDPSRRLTGNLDEASNGSRDVHTATPEAAALVSQRLLARLFEIKSTLSPDDGARVGALTRMAEDALSVDVASETWQHIASALVAARELASKGRRDDLQVKLNEIVTLVLSEARRHATAPVPGPDDRAIRSAWAAERDRR